MNKVFTYLGALGLVLTAVYQAYLGHGDAAALALSGALTALGIGGSAHLAADRTAHL